MQKVGCSNPGRDRPKSLKQVATAPLPNAPPQMWVSWVFGWLYKRMSRVTVKRLTMAVSAEYKSKIEALYLEWWHLHTWNNSLVGLKKQTNKFVDLWVILLGVFVPFNKFFKHYVKCCKFWTMQWDFYSVPNVHLLRHVTSDYNGHLRGPVALTTIAERLAVELSLLRSVNAGIWTPNCLFGFFVPLKNFPLIWRLHHYLWKAANFDLCSAHKAIEQ